MSTGRGHHYDRRSKRKLMRWVKCIWVSLLRSRATDSPAYDLSYRHVIVLWSGLLSRLVGGLNSLEPRCHRHYSLKTCPMAQRDLCLLSLGKKMHPINVYRTNKRSLRSRRRWCSRTFDVVYTSIAYGEGGPQVAAEAMRLLRYDWRH